MPSCCVKMVGCCCALTRKVPLRSLCPEASTAHAGCQTREPQGPLTPTQPPASLREKSQDRGCLSIVGTLGLTPTPRWRPPLGLGSKPSPVVTTFSHSTLLLSFWIESLPTAPLQGHRKTHPSQPQAHCQPQLPNSDSIAGASGILLIKCPHLTCDLWQNAYEGWMPSHGLGSHRTCPSPPPAQQLLKGEGKQGGGQRRGGGGQRDGKRGGGRCNRDHMQPTKPKI